ncbi:nucleotidyltransferase family protein [Petrimonas sulfuriphila]|jgi:dTDP-glucose pyrophosphorylase/CBS domain-containing protein|uniref:nucleotidyltransferase family protein n=1 Tax=Petrimonas sulfuriphila TaxID=285070 RepID=UPI003EB6D297
MEVDNKLKLSSNTSILNALQQMDVARKKLLLVFDKEKFVGLLSIGDIQRAIIKNLNLQSPISKIMREDIILADENDCIESIKNKMMQIRAEYMPVIGNNNEIVKIIFWEDLFGDTLVPPKKNFNLPIVVMAGGIGSRLKPLTNVLPKPLIPIGEKTIIEHIFDRFYQHGCNEFYISVNYKADLIKYYLTEQRLPFNLTYFKEDKPMGTAGSLSLLKNTINETFFVSNCDIVIEQDYSEILDYHKKSQNEITIVAALKTYHIPYGTLKSGENGELTELIEKPDLTFKINSGMYILEPHLIKEIPEDKFFHITHLIEKIKDRNGKIGIFPVSEKSWKDIGEWDEYLKNKY